MTKTDSAKTDSAKTDPAGAERPPTAFPFPWDLAGTPDGFARLIEDQVERSRAIVDELAVYEGVAMQRARVAIEDLARLTVDTIDYTARIAAEWRKLAIDAGRRTVEAMAPRAAGARPAAPSRA